MEIQHRKREGGCLEVWLRGTIVPNLSLWLSSMGWLLHIIEEHNDNSDDARGRGMHDYSTYPFEIQTAPIRGGVLPGVIRQVIIE
ncbi:hypothetical protein CsSME_00028308 [Camellia sinensis var. sinensis]